MKLFHRHTWKTVAVRPCTTNNCTLLLQKCAKCNNLRTKLIEGAWDLEDILNEVKDIDKQ